MLTLSDMIDAHSNEDSPERLRAAFARHRRQYEAGQLTLDEWQALGLAIGQRMRGLGVI